MKFIYIVILFLIFFNVFSFMIAWAVPFEYNYETGSEAYNISTDESMTPAESIYENVSGESYGDILSIFFGDLNSFEGIAITLGLLAEDWKGN